MTLAATGAQTLCTTVAEEQPLSAHPDTFMFQTHIQGQGNQMESHQQNRGSTSVAGMFPRQVSLHLSPWLFPPIRSRRWDADGIANALWMLLLNFTLRLCLLKSH